MERKIGLLKEIRAQKMSGDGRGDRLIGVACGATQKTPRGKTALTDQERGGWPWFEIAGWPRGAGEERSRGAPIEKAATM